MPKLRLIAEQLCYEEKAMAHQELANYRGRGVQLYLVDGDIDGMVDATIDGWTGQVTKVPRHLLSSFQERYEADQSAAYLLIGGEEGISAYIGETDNVKSRLTSHHGNIAKKAVFDHAYVITSLDRKLTKAHVRVLEHELYTRARAAGRFTITNGARPTSSSLPESQLAFMNAFFANVELLLSVLGLRILEPTITIPEVPAQPRLAHEVDDNFQSEGVYRLAYKDGDPAGSHLRGILLPDGRMLIAKGTRMSSTARLGVQQTTVREKMIDQGLVVPSPDGSDFLVQTSHIVYHRPTSAAALLTGRGGRKEKHWTHRSRVDMYKQTAEGDPETRDVNVADYPTIEIPRTGLSASDDKNP